MARPRVFADFQNADPQGRLRLNTAGTFADLSRQQIQLDEGVELTIYADNHDALGYDNELQAEGVVSYSETEHCWVATIDWSAIRHVPSTFVGTSNGASASNAAAFKGNLAK